MDDLTLAVLAEAFHEKHRVTAPSDTLGDEARLPWAELDVEYREAYTRTFEDLIDRDLIEPAPSCERAVEARKRTMAAGPLRG